MYRTVLSCATWLSQRPKHGLPERLSTPVDYGLNLLGYKVNAPTNAHTYRNAQYRNIYKKLGQLIVLGTFTASTKTPRCFWCYMAILRHCHQPRCRGNEVSLMAGWGQLWVSQQGRKTLIVSNNRHSLKPVIFPWPPIIIYQGTCWSKSEHWDIFFNKEIHTQY